MRKLTLQFAFIFITAINTDAQYEIGYLSGIGITDILEKSKSGNINDTYSEGLGYTIGSFINLTLLKEHLYFKSSIGFSEKGAYYPVYGSGGNIVGKRRENVYYLESPFQLQFRFFPIFKIQTGIYNAFRLNMKINEFGGYDDSYVNYDSRYDIGYTAGIIFEYKEYILEATYGKSFRSIGRVGYWNDDLQKIVKSDETRFYNQTLFFTFGYKIFKNKDKIKD